MSSNLFLLQNSQIIDLFEIKLDDFEGYFYFHGSKNLNRDIVFKGKVYLYIPCELSNLEYNSDGKQSRPTFTVSNINNFISNFIKDRSDLLGKRLYRKKIYSKDLDYENFGGAYKSLLGAQSFRDFISVDTFIINKKNTENKEKVEFALSNILDIDGLTAPTRKVYSDFCTWHYRGSGCNYGKILGYDGPRIEVARYAYNSLEQIVSEFPALDGNCLVWIKPGNGQTFGEELLMTGSKNADGSIRQLKARRLLNWANEANDINTTDITPLPEINLTVEGNSISGYRTRAPLEYINTGRVNNQTGIFFSHITKTFGQYNWAKLDIVNPGSTTYYDFNPSLPSTKEKYTVFCVYEHVQKLIFNSGWKVLSSDLSTFSSDDWVMGSDLGYLDRVYIEGNGRWHGPTSTTVKLNYDKLLVYSLTSSVDTNETLFYKYGNLIKRGTANRNYFRSLGINQYPSQTSECVLYELIVFKGVLTQQQIQSVHTYLAGKYATPIDNVVVGPEYKSSSAFFAGWEDGNLGIPMADENDKLFLANQQAFQQSFENYGIYNLVYKGDYNEQTQYARGDFVKLDPQIDFDFSESVIQKTSDLPSRFFVCVAEQGAKNLHPLKFNEIWIEDKCSKTLNGCFIRFRGDIPIPFGGFPGTITYDYKLPNS